MDLYTEDGHLAPLATGTGWALAAEFLRDKVSSGPLRELADKGEVIIGDRSWEKLREQIVETLENNDPPPHVRSTILGILESVKDLEDEEILLASDGFGDIPE